MHERHRHRYEVNPSVADALEAAGMRLVGRNKDGDTGDRMEVLELDETEHPYFMGAQVCDLMLCDLAAALSASALTEAM